jgi:hypothetical protein
MGNGALPHGPSDRTHPRLYRMRPTGRADQCPQWESNGLNADVAFGLFMDPERTPHLDKIRWLVSRPMASSARTSAC